MTYDGRIEAQFTVPSSSGVTVTNGAGAAKFITVPANTYVLTDFLFRLQTQLNLLSDSTAWTISLSTGASGTGKVTINCTGTWTFTFSSVEIRDILGFLTDIGSVSSAQTGASQARALWIPDCPLALDGDTLVAPIVSDLRSTMSPTGVVLGLIGNRRYVHKNVRWTAVPISRTWTVYETVTNQSWQTFVTDTQHALGTGAASLSKWFTPQSLCVIYDHRGNVLGNSVTPGWALIGVDAIAPTLTRPPWTGLWNIQIPTLVAQLAA